MKSALQLKHRLVIECKQQCYDAVAGLGDMMHSLAVGRCDGIIERDAYLQVAIHILYVHS